MPAPTYEISQATGAQAQVVYAAETDWGVSPTTGYHILPVVGGETLDDQIATYKSTIIRSDRMHNPTVRGSRKPGGSFPFELAPQGISPFFWHALGGTPVVTAGDGTTIPIGWNKHVIKGSVSLPTGFTLEKAFMDLATPKYFALKGCKVAKFQLKASVDRICSGAFDIMAREMHVDTASVATSPTAAVLSPSFTSVQMGIFKDGTQISVCQDLQLDVDNVMHDNSHVLGSVFRQNLKPGTRMTSGSAVFLFNNTVFYDAAVNGTGLSLKILASDGGNNSIEFLMPNVQLLPNNTSPKIQNDGPLTISANYEANKDPGLGTDIQITIISQDTTINY